jgi:hypothetical protein
MSCDFVPAEVLSAGDVFGVEKWKQISVFFGIGASKKYRRMIPHFLLLYFVYSQILLISLMDVSHFSYITKLKRKALGHLRWGNWCHDLYANFKPMVLIASWWPNYKLSRGINLDYYLEHLHRYSVCDSRQ